MGEPYRGGSADVEAARNAYDKGAKALREAKAELEHAKRLQRAVWSPRIFAAIVGLGVAIGFASTARTCAAWVVAPSPRPACEEDALKLGEQRHACHNGARLELADGIARCVCPRDVDGGR